MADCDAHACALVRTIRSLADASLRVSYVTRLARTVDAALLARHLEVVCRRAESAEPAAREALVAIVDALNAPDMNDVVRQLREQAAREPLLALERLVRSPERGARETSGDGGATDAASLGALPLEDAGRVLTLGERKALARRPDRDMTQKLLGDTHPAVIGALLRSARVVEDDVVRLAARRPGRAEVLAEIARATKWSHRPRVRMALVMNPATPADIALRIAGLLLRPELERVLRSPAVLRSVRARCLEHLERRPPVASIAAVREPERNVH